MAVNRCPVCGAKLQTVVIDEVDRQQCVKCKYVVPLAPEVQAPTQAPE